MWGSPYDEHHINIIKNWLVWVPFIGTSHMPSITRPPLNSIINSKEDYA